MVEFVVQLLLYRPGNRDDILYLLSMHKPTFMNYIIIDI